MAFDEKNIRRRIYDALNVLMAMDIISKVCFVAPLPPFFPPSLYYFKYNTTTLNPEAFYFRLCFANASRMRVHPTRLGEEADPLEGHPAGPRERLQPPRGGEQASGRPDRQEEDASGGGM